MRLPLRTRSKWSSTSTPALSAATIISDTDKALVESRAHDGVEEDLFQAFSSLQDDALEQVDRLYDLFLEASTNTVLRMPNAYAPLYKHYRHIYLRPFKCYVAYQGHARRLGEQQQRTFPIAFRRTGLRFLSHPVPAPHISGLSRDHPSTTPGLGV